MKPKLICLTVVCAALAASCASAQTRLTVDIADQPGPAIPQDFAGLSFESSNLNPDKQGQHLFSPDNKPLIELFRAIGIRNLRVGGGTADGPEFKIPGPGDIDQLFGFAKAADVKVIYTVRLLNGDARQDAAIAQYIQQHYASQLVCFQIGNEPDWHSFHTSPGHERDPRIVETTPEVPGTAYPSFLEGLAGVCICNRSERAIRKVHRSRHRLGLSSARHKKHGLRRTILDTAIRPRRKGFRQAAFRYPA